jgi:hypothetical protein
LSEADQHLSLYNAAKPSEENQRKLLIYNIEILILTYEQENPENAIRSLERMLNRMQQLNISLSAHQEGQAVLFDVANSVCSQQLDDFQKKRCQTIFEQILSR